MYQPPIYPQHLEAQIPELLQHLNSDESACLEAIYLKGHNYQEVMASHGWTFNQVRGYRDRGIRKLRQLLTDLSADGGS